MHSLQFAASMRLAHRRSFGCEVCAESLSALGRKCADHLAEESSARGEPTVACVRYYPNGEFRREPRVPSDVATWLDYNRKFRWGNSLFVEGKCVQRGVGFSEAECAEIERALAAGTRWMPGRQPRPSRAG
jgi:hypothetical protein